MAGRFNNQPLKEEYQKWDYITLTDFRSASLGKVFSYFWVWFLAIVSVAVYAADSYTAVNLLIFGRWASQIQPAIPVNISRWIFAGCILLSFVLCIYSWVRAIAIIRRNNVAECYLDSMTVTLQSLRVTKKGQGWRRFLVFAALTKSKKGADYIALFVHFQFKGALRLLLAESPRQVINGMTLYSVMRAQLLAPQQSSDNPIVQFFKNIEVLAQTHTEQATILFTMLFTFIIWVVSFLSFLSACIAWLTFLWYYVPREYGTLSKYCRRKVEKRLERIINDKAKLALEREAAQSRRDEEKGITRPGQVFDPLSRRPTLPLTSDTDSDYQASVLKGTAALSRTDSSSWRPPQSSGSYKSFASDQPLLRQPTLPAVAPDLASKPLPNVSQTGAQDSDDVRKPTLPQIDIGSTAPDRPAGPVRTATQSSGASTLVNKPDLPFLPQTVDRGFTASPGPLEEDAPQRRPLRQNTLGRQPLPPSRLATSTPYPDDNSVMGRENSLSSGAPAPQAGPPPDRPLPAYPRQQKRRPTDPSNGWQQPPSTDIEMQPQQQQQQQQQQLPPPSLRIGAPQAQVGRTPSPPAARPAAAAPQWPLKSPLDQLQSDLPARQQQEQIYRPNRAYDNPPVRSATADPYSGGPMPPRSGTAPPRGGARNDGGYGPPPRSRTAQLSDGPGRMMRPQPPPPSSSLSFQVSGGPRRGPGPGPGYAPRPGPVPRSGPPPGPEPRSGYAPGYAYAGGPASRPEPGSNRGGYDRGYNDSQAPSYTGGGGGAGGYNSYTRDYGY